MLGLRALRQQRELRRHAGRGRAGHRTSSRGCPGMLTCSPGWPLTATTVPGCCGDDPGAGQAGLVGLQLGLVLLQLRVRDRDIGLLAGTRLNLQLGQLRVVRGDRGLVRVDHRLGGRVGLGGQRVALGHLLAHVHVDLAELAALGEVQVDHAGAGHRAGQRALIRGDDPRHVPQRGADAHGHEQQAADRAGPGRCAGVPWSRAARPRSRRCPPPRARRCRSARHGPRSRSVRHGPRSRSGTRVRGCRPGSGARFRSGSHARVLAAPPGRAPATWHPGRARLHPVRAGYSGWRRLTARTPNAAARNPRAGCSTPRKPLHLDIGMDRTQAQVALAGISRVIPMSP